MDADKAKAASVSFIVLLICFIHRSLIHGNLR